LCSQQENTNSGAASFGFKENCGAFFRVNLGVGCAVHNVGSYAGRSAAIRAAIASTEAVQKK
jgi:hypothetical protein